MEPEAKKSPSEISSRRVLRAETRGLILLALMILAVYLLRYLHILHRSRQ